MKILEDKAKVSIYVAEWGDSVAEMSGDPKGIGDLERLISAGDTLAALLTVPSPPCPNCGAWLIPERQSLEAGRFFAACGAGSFSSFDLKTAHESQCAECLALSADAAPEPPIPVAALPPHDQLRARIAFWRREYSAFGHLSGETLSEMDVAAALPPVEADTMPTIEVGDTIVHGRPHEPPQFMYEVTDYECRGWQGDANVVAILRTLWRRPSPQEPTWSTLTTPESQE